MNPKIAIKATIAILVIALTISIAFADWSQFHHDPERTGNVSGDAPLTDTLLWKTQLSSNGGGCIEGGASVVDDRVYVSNCPDMDSRHSEILGLYCLNNSTGEILWGNPLGGKGGRSTPAISGDRIFVGSCTGDLYCVNASDGETIWHETIETNPAWWETGDSPLVCENKVFISSFSDGSLHVFDFDGNKLWNITTGGGIGSYTSPAASDGRIFFAGGDPAALYCVNIRDHSILWKFKTYDALKTTPAIEEDIVFFANTSRMHAVDMAGEEVWNRSLKATISSPAIAYGRVYIGSSDGGFYCFNASNGNDIWNLSVSGDIVSSPAVADDTVYFGTNIGGEVVYALNATDGTVRWSYDTGDCIMSSPSISNGTMFIGSDTGYLYAFGTPDKFWKGNVVLLCGETLNVTANNSSTNYVINRTTALGALVKAAGCGGFNFTINNSCLAFVDSIAEVSNNETEGKYWRYHVNYHPDDPEPTISADKFELNASSTARDVVTFYYGNERITPENSTMAIQITTQIIEKKPEAIFITVERRDFIENATEKSNLNITLLPPSDVWSGIDLTGYDLIFLEHLSGTSAENLKGPIETANAGEIAIICIHSGGYNDEFGNVNLTEHWFIEEYWDNYAEENIARLLTYLEVNFCDLIGDVKDPVPVPKAYIHHPDTAELFFDTATYLEWYVNNTGNTSHQYDPCNLTIGVANWYTFTRSADVERLIHTLEQKGANVISTAFAGTDDLKEFYIVNNETIVDTIICTKSFRINYGDPDQGVADLETLNVPVMRAVRLYYMAPWKWRTETSHGISIMDLGFQVGMPELDGIIDPIVIAGKNASDSEYQPIDEQINWTCDRAIRWAHLNSTPNAEKRIAMIYYNHGGGKDNLGACYVNVPPSLQNLLDAMNRSGYTVVKGEIPNETELVRMMTLNGTNIGTWAPGELERLVASGTATLLPVKTYLEWFGKLGDERQKEVNERWDEPPGEIMVWANNTTKEQYFVIPKLSFGNMILTPQPTRGWLQNNTVLYHNRDIPPHHQYIAFYLWLKQEQESGGFGADAIMHFGKHGTQEWLPGKESGLSADDCWPAILIQDMPVIYPYIVDNIAEGTQAKRRGSATMITHLTPPIVAAGLYGNLTNLLETTSFYLATDVNGSVKEEYKKTIISECEELNLDDDLKVNLTTMDNATFDNFTVELAEYLYDLKTDFMPYGLHTFGEPPEGEPEVALIISMLRGGYKREIARMIGYEGYPDPLQTENESKLDNRTTQLIEEVLNGTDVITAQKMLLNNQSSDELTEHLNRAIRFADNLSACDIEVNNTLEGFDGDYISPSPADDPIRNSDVIPTGRNFYSMNPDRVPTKEAWTTGQKMADALIERYQKDHNDTYPRKLAIVLWAWAMTDQGVVESEILHLVGAKPVWDRETKRVIDVKLVNASELGKPGKPGEFGRPRIDVMVVPSGLHRDLFPEKLKLIDRAIRLAENATPEQDEGYANHVKNNTCEILKNLTATGDYTGVALEENATYLSVSRIFLEAPGTYGPNLDSAIGASGTWNNSSKIGNLFVSRMHYIYGDEVWGIPGEYVFKLNLAQIEGIVHNQNSNLYGFIDNDDVFQYVGGLALAYKAVTGEYFDSDDIYVTDNSDLDSDPTVSSLHEVICKELRTRYLNPKWIEGMMGEGYAGAREMTKFVEYLWGWEATVPDIITDSMWDRVYDVYVNGAYGGEYDIGEFASEHNPYAYQSLTGRMLETIRKGYWTPSSIEVRNALVSEYVESIVKNGVTCCHHTCANPFLDAFVSGIVSVPGVVSDKDAARYREIMDTATGKMSTSSSQSGNSGGKSGSGTYPPEWEETPTISHTSPTASNETATEGGVGTDVDQPMNPSKQSESNYVEGSEMTVEKSGASSSMLSFSGAPMIGMILVIALMVIIYWGYRRRR